MDKDVLKSKSMSIDPPTSAASLHQFLSQHSKTVGVKIEGAFKAPVLKVRTSDPKKLDAGSRKAWYFYLYNMQQRLVGSGHAINARESIDALFKREPLKLSVGMLLGPLEHLILAEQERLALSNSHVRRWLAKEKAFLQCAVPLEPGEQYGEEANRKKEALVTACTVLSKFSDCKDGEIDTDNIRREAYKIGHGLTEEEFKALGSARITLMSRQDALADFIGPEGHLLISLCINAHDKAESAFLSDDSPKSAVSQVATALRGRTDTNEYLMPTSPRTIAQRTVRRQSMPVFYAQETTTMAEPTASTSTSTSTSTTPTRLTPEKGNAETRTTPPAHSPPSTPGRDATDADRSGQSTPLSASASSQSVAKRYGGGGGAPLNLSAAINELKNKQQSESDPANSASSALHSVTPPVTPRRPFLPSSAGTPTDSDASTTKAPKPHSS